MIAVALWLVLAPAAADSGPPPFELEADAGLGLAATQLRSKEIRIPPSAGAMLGAAPRWRLTPRLQLGAFARYATTLRARVHEEAPGGELSRPIRWGWLDFGVAAHVWAVQRGGVRLIVGAGLGGSFIDRFAPSPGILSDAMLGTADVQIPVQLRLGDRGEVFAVGGGGVAVRNGTTRVFGTYSATVGARLWLGSRLGVHVTYVERGLVDAGLDALRLASVGVSLRASPRNAPERREPPPAPVAAEVEPSRPAAQPLRGTTLAGDAFDLSAHRGSVVVVDFWASWCGPCREALPALDGLAAQKADDGLVVVAVSMDETEGEARAFVESLGLSLRVVHDTDRSIAEAWSPEKMPTTFVIDADGNVAATFAGFQSGDDAAIAATVERLLSARG